MARDAAGEAPVLEMQRRRRGIRWQRWLGLSIPIMILLALLVFGAGADVLAKYDPEHIDVLNRLKPPIFDGGTWDYPLGTDDLGRDMYSRLVHGARVSVIVVGIVVPGAALIGTLLGLVAGWVGGLTGQFLMRLVDVQLALPAILFAVLLAALVGASLRNVIIILLIWTWPSYARLVRADVLSLRERDFVTASLATGGTSWWIMRKHLFPNVVNTVVIIMTLEVALVILAEAALSFLTVGVPPGTASWGRMITEGLDTMGVAWWTIWLPGLALLVISLTGNMMGDWLRDTLDPRLRNVR
ncbi:MAG: ABC transporter permease [Chloroflexi bacterium]|nr:ABC transporter permease [Chloroflexota bacterium]